MLFRSKKRIEQLCMDSVAKGLFSCLIELPFQPKKVKDDTIWVGELKYKGRSLKDVVQGLMPGCTIDYVEVEGEDDDVRILLEVSWRVEEKVSESSESD